MCEKASKVQSLKCMSKVALHFISFKIEVSTYTLNHPKDPEIFYCD